MMRPALAVDLDGTLFVIGDRSPYDADRCGLDTVNPMVHQVMKWAQADGWAILLVSARGIQKTHRAYTEQALTWNEIYYDELFMRRAGDGRPDRVVKEEIYHRFIEGNWDVRLILDDNGPVVSMWRHVLKLTCFQVDDRLDEVAQLRQAVVDAHGEAVAEAVRADVAQAQRDQARRIAREAIRMINGEYGFSDLRSVLDLPGWTVPGLDAENYPEWLIDDESGAAAITKRREAVQ